MSSACAQVRPAGPPTRPGLRRGPRRWFRSDGPKCSTRTICRPRARCGGSAAGSAAGTRGRRATAGVVTAATPVDGRWLGWYPRRRAATMPPPPPPSLSPASVADPHRPVRRRSPLRPGRVGALGVAEMRLMGGTGLIGRRLVWRLADRGDDVAVLSRKPNTGNGLPAGVRSVVGDPAFPVTGSARSMPPTPSSTFARAGLGLPLGRGVPRADAAAAASTDLIARRLAERPTGPTAGRGRWWRRRWSATTGPPGDERLTEESPLGRDVLAELCGEWERAPGCWPTPAGGRRRCGLGAVLDPDGAGEDADAVPARPSAAWPAPAGSG